VSTDESVTKDLIQTLEDGKEGFAKGADKLESSNEPQLAATFRRYSEQRASFSAELDGLAASYGDQIDQSGSIAGALHRGWMSLKDALAGDDPDGVLDAAEQGEDHAVKEYEKALASDISEGLRVVVARQASEVEAAHAQVRALRDQRK
jgi:uncharacterized protein (TIGR02284 family)